MLPRIVCQFSCGAASAVATKLVLGQLGHILEVVIVNAFIVEEHPDNRRFLADCQEWFGRPVEVLSNEKYKASVREVFRREQYLKGRYGTPCSRALKRKVLDVMRRPNDVLVLGYTAEESARYESFLEEFPDTPAIAPLIDRGLTKNDVLAMVERAGIELPMMYRLGYQNANCIGCVKGGQGYWNKIRRDFPEHFWEMAMLELDLGPGAYLFRDRKTGQRYPLVQLDPNSGRHDEPLPSCSGMCEVAEAELDNSRPDPEEPSLAHAIGAR
jgi:3'-phosphoadenosine 5'-phosphosulfate sulfotransferase (PAPS reductase)/FAD synthetase